MAVADQDPRNSYIANGVTTTFAYTFKIFEDRDLVVEVDGVIKTLTTDYTVTGAGASGGGNVVFVSAPANGAEVVIYRDLPYTRETDYSEDLLSNTLNDDIDRTIMLIQQDRRDRYRAIKVPMAETGDQVIDDVTTRAGGVLGFDDTTGELKTKFIADLGVVEAGDGLQLAGEVLSVKVGDGLKIASGALAVDPLETLMISGGNMTGALNEAADTIAAHATTCDIWSKPNNLTLTEDAVTFTDLADAPQAGAVRWIKSNAAHVLTNNENLIVQSGANVTLAAGDWFRVEAITVDTFNILIFRADGKAVVETAPPTQVAGGLKIGAIIPGGVGAYTLGANDMFGSRFKAPLTTTITRLGIQLANATNGQKLTLGIYADSSGVPGAKLGQTSEMTLTVPGDNYQEIFLTLASPVDLVAGTNYWLVNHSDVGIDVERFCSRLNRNKYRTIPYNATLPDPFGTPTGDSLHVIAMAGY